jgi:hypothetical protein
MIGLPDDPTPGPGLRATVRATYSIAIAFALATGVDGALGPATVPGIAVMPPSGRLVTPFGLVAYRSTATLTPLMSASDQAHCADPSIPLASGPFCFNALLLPTNVAVLGLAC